MNLKKILAASVISLSMVAGVGASVGLATGANLEVEEVKADARKYYYRGTGTDGDYTGDWSAYTAKELYDDESNSQTFSFTNGESFKFSTTVGEDWSGELKNNTLAGTAVQLFSGGYNSDIVYNGTTGVTLKVSINGTTIYFDHLTTDTVYYDGDSDADGDWDGSYDFGLKFDGTPVERTFIKGEEFGFKINGAWYDMDEASDLLNSSGTYYSFYRSFVNKSGKMNYVSRFAGSFYVSVYAVNHTVKITFSEVGTTTIYVLDLNGNMLSGSSKAAYCHSYRLNESSEAVATTEYPGAAMTLVEGTSNIYSATFPSFMNTVIINNNNGSKTVAHTFSANECLLLRGHLNGYGEWDYSDWVEHLETAKFVDSYMHFADEGSREGESGSGNCKSSGWYTTAKDAYELSTFSSYREDLCTVSFVVDRLQAWATANGATFDNGSFSSARVSVSPIVSNNTNVALIAGIAAGAMITAIGASFLLRRKKEN